MARVFKCFCGESMQAEYLNEVTKLAEKHRKKKHPQFRSMLEYVNFIRAELYELKPLRQEDVSLD